MHDAFTTSVRRAADSGSWGYNMKRHYLVLFSLQAALLLTACGGGGSVDVATHLSVTAPPMAVAGTDFQVTVTALDATGNVVTSYPGTVHFSSTDGQAVLPGNSTLTNGTGTFSATLRTAGSATITATDTVTASITGTSSSIDVSAGPATHFAVSAPSTAQSGTAFDLTVTALDASNNVAKSYTGTVHFSSTDPQAVLPGSATLADGAGTFPAILETAGSQSISATDTLAASITGTSSPVGVSPGPPTHFAVSAPTTALPGATFNFTVSALDGASNVATSYAGSVHFSSTDAQAVLPVNSPLTNGTATFAATLQTAGSQTITATDTVTSITGTSSAINVRMESHIHFVVSAPTTAQSGTAFEFTVTAFDQGVATHYTGTVHFSSTDAQAVLPSNAMLTDGMATFSATLETAGSQTITATDTVTTSITGISSSIDVSAGPATHFSVSAPVSVRSGTAFDLIVAARDAANNLADSYAGTVQFSSTDAKAALPANATLTDGMGIFSAKLQTTGSQTITATDTVTASIVGSSNTIEVFVNCSTKGEYCGAGIFPGCCPGLACVVVGMTGRMKCE